MMAFRASRRLTSWLTVLALLTAALLPAAARTLAAGDSATWVEVCTVQGSKWVAAESAEGESPAAHVVEHCLYCSAHVPDLALPPAGRPPLPDAPASDQRPASREFASRSAAHLISAQPRAPPTHS